MSSHSVSCSYWGVTGDHCEKWTYMGPTNTPHCLMWVDDYGDIPVSGTITMPDSVSRGRTYSCSGSGTITVTCKSGCTASGNSFTVLAGADLLKVSVRSDLGKCTSSSVSKSWEFKRNQSLTYTGSTDLIVDQPIHLSAESNSGLIEFTYSVDNGAIIQDDMLLTSKPGLYSLTVVQSGDNNWRASSITVAIVCGISKFDPSLILTSDGGVTECYSASRFEVIVLILLLSNLCARSRMRSGTLSLL